MRTITIDPVTRIEGHATVTIRLGDDGRVAGSDFHVTQVRGFERFTEGRPFYEMPALTARICGICPVSHMLASSKACDAIMAVRIPRAARLLRELVHFGQILQSHALSFFYLSAPDLLLGMDSDPAARNVLGLVASHPEIARDGIELRKYGLQIVEAIANERVHGAGIVPGGVSAPLGSEVRDRLIAELPAARAIARRALDLFKTSVPAFAEEIDGFGSAPLMSAALVDNRGKVQFYDAWIRLRAADGKVVAEFPGEDYAQWIGEASVRESYMKAPYFKPAGFPDGVYRVGPLARLNAGDRYGTDEADREAEELRATAGPQPQGAFFYHYARLIEMLHALERIDGLLHDPDLLDPHVRASAQVNAAEGVGVIEAPRGLLIHHYKVDDNGAIVWANLIVATGHNNLAIGRSIQHVSEKFIDGTKLTEGMLNRVSAVVRAYDPCLSCSTHAAGQIAMRVKLLGPGGDLLDDISRF